LFLVAEGSEVRLEVSGEGLQGATGGGHEAIELSPLKEGGDEAEAASALLLKGDQGSQDKASEEGFAAGGTQEGNEVGVKVGGAVTAEPVAEGGARYALVVGILSLARVVGMAEVVLCFGGVNSRPTESGCARVGGFATLRESHGSRPVVSPGRATIEKRAMLVQGRMSDSRRAVNARTL